MPKQITEVELQPVLQALRNGAEALSVQEIRQSLQNSMSRRTLQRRLAFLVQRKQIMAEGRGRGSRYKWSTPLMPLPTLVPTSRIREEPRSQSELPLSLEGEQIRSLIKMPLHMRTPVGYQRDFLEKYRPNETFYLPEDIRRRLAEKGRAMEQGLPAGTYVRQIYNRLLIDLSWNSSRLEGNTYSLLETERLLELGQQAAGKNQAEAQMILNHKSAIELLVDEVGGADFNRYTLLNLHALLSDNLLSEPSACGRVRSIPVGVGGTVFQPLNNPPVLEECFQQILDSARAIRDPFEQAFFVMVHIPYLQPFEDVNKRVSRLAANIPLIKGNFCPLSFVDVPKQAYIDGLLAVYELNRVELLRDVFVWAYGRSCERYTLARRQLGEPDPFRMRYRAAVAEAVAFVVRGSLDKQHAADLARMRAQEGIEQADRLRFVEVVETELMSLHEGNIARYRLRPSEYENWRMGWR
jgi:hypothetical protein